LQYKCKKRRRTNNNVSVVFSSTTGIAPIATLVALLLATAPAGAKEAAMTPSSFYNLFVAGLVSSWVPSPKILT
jgi:hypothetical protein